MTKEQLFSNILNRINEGIYVVDVDRKIVYWNQAAEQITGYKAEEVTGSYCQNNILQHIDQEGKPICLVGCPLFATLKDGKIRVEQVFLRHKDGFRLAVTVRIFPVVENGRVIAATEVFTPISNKVYDDDLVVSLATSAMTDELTKLPNRKYLEDMLAYKIRQYQRFGSQFCVMFLDIDNFSRVNNTFGHDTGDIILRNLGDIVTRQLRKTDIFGRWGGEEFLGIYAITTPDEPFIISEKIRCQIEQCRNVGTDGDLIGITVSIGVTNIHPDDSVASVVRRADRLMYVSKENGKNRTTFEV